MSNDLLDRGSELRRHAGDDAKRNEVQRRASALGGGPIPAIRRIAFVQQNGDTPGAWLNLVQDPDQLAQNLFALVGNAGDVAPRLGQTCDKPVADGV